MADINIGGYGRYIKEAGERCNWGRDYQSPLPNVGEVRQGYEFLGGDPKEAGNWRKASSDNSVSLFDLIGR